MGVERAEVERRWLDWGGWVQASGSVSVGFGSFSYSFVAPQSEGRWVGGWAGGRVEFATSPPSKPLIHLQPLHADDAELPRNTTIRLRPSTHAYPLTLTLLGLPLVLFPPAWCDVRPRMSRLTPHRSASRTIALHASDVPATPNEDTGTKWRTVAPGLCYRTG